MSFLYYKAINWNETHDTLDQYTWEKLTNNFWLDIRVPVQEDRQFWETLSGESQARIGKLLASASLNTALQSEIGAASLRTGIQTQQEEAVLNVTTFMESVHTKAVTTIYRALISPEQATSFYKFADDQQLLAQKLAPFERIFAAGDNLQKKAAFIFLETALTFGHYAPILMEAQLPQTNQMIQNMLQGSAIFTAYLGYKFQQAFKELPTKAKTEFTTWLEDFTADAMLTETKFFEAELGEATASSTNIMAYGANYALDSLGFKRQFSEELPIQIKQYLAGLLITTEQLAQQAQTIQSSQLETMENDDYDF
ncbi:ribonucleotide-diphosphate reductase subunit beta [Enterococcus pingfangensis]